MDAKDRSLKYECRYEKVNVYETPNLNMYVYTNPLTYFYASLLRNPLFKKNACVATAHFFCAKSASLHGV